MNPSPLAIQPRVEEARSVVPTRTLRPASRACFSVIPTEPTSGSVKVTCGTAVYDASGPSCAEDVARGDRGLVHRHVREGALAGDVADRPEPVAGAHPPVGVDGPRGRVEADRLQAEVRQVGAAAGRDEQLVGLQRLAVHLDREVPVGVGHRRDRRRRRAPGCPGGRTRRPPACWPPAPRARASGRPPPAPSPAPRSGSTPARARPRSRRHRPRSASRGSPRSGVRRGWSSTACPPAPRWAAPTARCRC